MNSLLQYIDLYKEHRAVIEAHSPAVLNDLRPAALALLEDVPRLPEKGDEGYEAVSVNEMFSPDYGLNIARVAFPADPRKAFACDVPNVSRMSAMVVNDTYVSIPGVEERLPEGVEMMSLREAAERYPELVASPIAPADNAAAALNTLLVQDGVFIKVAAGVELDRPMQVLSIFNASAAMMAVRRVKIFIGDGARASVLLCDHPRIHDFDYMNSRVVEISVGRDASLDVYDLEEATPRTRRMSMTASEQCSGSRLNIVSLFLNGGQTRNEYYPRHCGEHCHTSLNGIVIAGGAQVVDNSVMLSHSTPHCNSSQLFKYALFDSSYGAFEGLVTVEEGATFTEAQQTNRNLLVSENARMHAMPQLVINCDEVKASHGSATGQLNDDALFYMRSRGIHEPEARMMLINAFMADVLDAIACEPLREKLRCLVDKRLNGEENSCDSCSAINL